jgi:hypothetical protein
MGTSGFKESRRRNGWNGVWKCTSGREAKSDTVINPQNTTSPAQQPDAIRENVRRRGTLLMQPANSSFRAGRSPDIHPSGGHIIGDAEAQRFRNRSYEPRSVKKNEVNNK